MSSAPVRLATVDTGVEEFTFSGVSKAFVDRDDSALLAVHDIDLQVSRGEFVCLVGPSGCGKSTLLNMAAGLMRPSRGDVMFRGQAVDGVNPSVGYVTQQDNLLPWRTVAGNIEVPLVIRSVPRNERRARVEKILERVGLADFAGRFPSQLSGGMRKRTALARTLVYEPDTLLMDEPFGPLDAQLRLTMQQELLQLWEGDRRTVVFVTHDLEEAILLADRVVVFSRRPGAIVHIAKIDLPRPRDIVALRSTPEFQSQWSQLWSLLGPQVEEGSA